MLLQKSSHLLFEIIHLLRFEHVVDFLLFITLLLGEAQAKVKKLCNEDEFLAAFESGQQKVKVIIGLEMPQHLKSIKSFKDEQFKAQVRAEIAGRQSTVLSGLSANEFVLSHRYNNFECFAGEVTLSGLGKLLAHPLVKSIELSGLEHKMLAQGIGLINAMTSSPITVAPSSLTIDIQRMLRQLPPADTCAQTDGGL